MAILFLPTLSRGQIKAEWRLVSNTQSHESPLSKVTQTLELPGAHWQATIHFPKLQNADTRILAAFAAKLRGMAGMFYLHDATHPTPRGVATGTPLVDGASQTGASLNVKGLTADTDNILMVGDYFEVNNELKILTENSHSDATGKTTLVFEPPIRNSPADEAVITIIEPKAVMRLKDDRQAKWLTEPPLLTPMSLECVEKFIASGLDVTAPVFSSAVVENATPTVIEVTLSKVINSPGGDYKGGFRVKVNGSVVTINTGARDAVQSVILLTLASAIVAGNTVTVEYTLTTGDIEDQATSPNTLETFTAQSVQNNVT